MESLSVALLLVDREAKVFTTADAQSVNKLGLFACAAQSRDAFHSSCFSNVVHQIAHFIGQIADKVCMEVRCVDICTSKLYGSQCRGPVCSASSAVVRQPVLRASSANCIYFLYSIL